MKFIQIKFSTELIPFEWLTLNRILRSNLKQKQVYRMIDQNQKYLKLCCKKSFINFNSQNKKLLVSIDWHLTFSSSNEVQWNRKTPEKFGFGSIWPRRSCWLILKEISNHSSLPIWLKNSKLQVLPMSRKS